MKDSFFSFDDEIPAITRALDHPRSYLGDPRDAGGVLLETKLVDRASCSICSARLRMEIFYFDGKTRKFVRCEGCNKYLFELERRKKR